MSRSTMMTLFGGALVAIAVFITNSGIAFDTGELSGSVALIQLIAGLGIILFILVRQPAWAVYFVVAAITIAAIGLVDLFREGGPGVTLGYIVLLVGAVLAAVGVPWRAKSTSSS